MKHMIIVVLSALVFAGCQRAPLQKTDSTAAVKPGVSEMIPADARPAVEAAYSQLVDIREPAEYAAGHAYRARNIPLGTLAENLDKLEKNEPVYLICQTSNRSREAAKILEANGFGQIVVIAGGTNAWQAAGLPMASGVSAIDPSSLDDKTRNALIEAIDDERRSRALYQAMADKFSGARPFINILEAEKRHEERLLPLFHKYRIAVPENRFDPAKIPVPESRQEACRVGEESEKKNIEMYEGYFKFVKEQDVIDAFKYLQAASRDNHLPAFTRCAESGGPGRGRPN